MRKYLFPVIIVLNLMQSYSQGFENLVFIDGCSNQLVKPQYDVCTESVFLLRIQYALDGTDNISFGSSIVDIRKPISDTIVMSSFLFSVDKKSKTGKFLNCGQPLQGLFTEYFINGNKRFEGVFSDGNLIEIKSYGYKGTLKDKKYFILGTLKATRIDYFDNQKNLEKYELYNRKKKRTIVKTFNKKNEVIARNVYNSVNLINFDIRNPNNVSSTIGNHNHLKYLNQIEE